MQFLYKFAYSHSHWASVKKLSYLSKNAVFQFELSPTKLLFHLVCKYLTRMTTAFEGMRVS